ncbi:MAG TPA: glycosyltransferase [Casimicrobiaceae bacterium]|nr:glycosyltransferase [Casimicrobiaceae bacterium]
MRAAALREGDFLATVHFVARDLDRSWRDLAALHETDVDRQPLRFRGGNNSWIVQSYLRLAEPLRALGLRATIGPSLAQDAINVAHRDALSRVSMNYRRHFVVGVRADRPPIRVARWEIVQNLLARPAARRRYIPLWPQPGLRARHPQRGNAIVRIAYFGRTGACPAWVFDAAFHDALRALGVEFRIQERDWHDYSDVDLVLSPRVESRTMLRQKPASKLVNAWRAGVPLLACDEPAFEALRRTALDYIAIRTPHDVLAAVQHLRAHPHEYRARMEAGLERGRAFSVAVTRARWLDLLTREALLDFAATDQRGSVASAVCRVAWQKCESRWFKSAAHAQRAIAAWREAEPLTIPAQASLDPAAVAP